MEECYHALSDQLDWNNPEGNQYPYDLSKPLPLHKYRGRLTVPVNFFFNNDLEYLRGGSTDRMYTTSMTKTKAVKYDVEGIEDMVPKLWSPIKVAYDRHDVYSTMRILSVTSVTVYEWYRYGYLKEIVVRRADQKLYKFMEGAFPRLHLNAIKDMLLLVAQNKLNNLDVNAIVHLAVGLRMYTRRIVIQSRVEDLQLGVESYQKKLNISKPRTCDVDLSRRAMKKRKLTTTDQKWTRIMIKDINQQLLHRRIMRSLDKFIGGRDYGTDYMLLQQTV
ncbi:hypothetical protein Tco_1437497 [Tanacetum coccineum]